MRKTYVVLPKSRHSVWLPPFTSFIETSNKCGCVHHVLCGHAQGMRVIEPRHAPIIFLCHGSPEDNAPARTRTPPPPQVTVFNVPIIILYCYCIRSRIHVVAHIPRALHRPDRLWEKTPKNNAPGNFQRSQNGVERYSADYVKWSCTHLC